MTKVISAKNKPINGLDNKFRGILASTPWTLCVGAGISVGLIPTWQELTRRVVNTAFGATFDDKEFEAVLAQTRWALDALLQGAASRFSLDGKLPEDFDALLEHALYSDLLQKAEAAGVEEALVDALNNPRWLKHVDLKRLYEFFESTYTNCTLVQLSQIMAEANEAGRGPKSIINFNADTLLYALLEIFLIIEHRTRTGRIDFPAAPYTKLLRSNVSPDRDVIPIFHCHGALAPIPKKKSKSSKRRDSRDHLVFREQEYLDLAGSVSPWAQSLFLFHAQSSPLLIIGHSLADSNIRRWLGWTHATSLKDFSSISQADQVTPRHMWIAKVPASKAIQEIEEASLLHLGVRPCWISDWSDIGATLRNLLAL